MQSLVRGYSCLCDLCIGLLAWLICYTLSPCTVSQQPCIQCAISENRKVRNVKIERKAVKRFSIHYSINPFIGFVLSLIPQSEAFEM